MKITQLEIVKVPPSWVWLFVHTDEGLTGLGEPFLENHADSVIAATGPISLGPTPATAHSGRITEMMPIPKTPTTNGQNRSGKYGMSR